MSTVQRHFVTFHSPGTFFRERTTREIDRWDPMLALEMSRSIVERFGARPFGFRFSTRGPHDLDGKQVAQSPMYFFGGRIETLEEIEARNDPKEEILRANMRGNGWARMYIAETPWRSASPLDPGDVVLDANGNIIHTEPPS